jgi:hypothetical protein
METFLGLEWPESKANHSPHFSTKIKNMWIYTSIPFLLLLAWCLTNHKEIFYFLIHEHTHSWTILLAWDNES